MTCAGTCVAEDAELCGGCWAQLAARLREVPGLVEEIDVTLTRQDKLTAGRVGGKGSETPLPFNAGASVAKSHLRYFLGTWARDVAERSGSALPAAAQRDVTTDAAVWLLEHEGAVRHHPAAGDLYEELTEAIWSAVRAIDRPADRVFAGWCCAALYARPGATNVVCRGCGTEHEVQACRDDMLARLEDYTGTAAEVSHILGVLGVPVPRNTITKWAARGKLPTGGRYRVGDVFDLTAA